MNTSITLPTGLVSSLDRDKFDRLDSIGYLLNLIGQENVRSMLFLDGRQGNGNTFQFQMIKDIIGKRWNQKYSTIGLAGREALFKRSTGIHFRKLVKTKINLVEIDCLNFDDDRDYLAQILERLFFDDDMEPALFENSHELLNSKPVSAFESLKVRHVFPDVGEGMKNKLLQKLRAGEIGLSQLCRFSSAMADSFKDFVWVVLINNSNLLPDSNRKQQLLERLDQILACLNSYVALVACDLEKFESWADSRQTISTVSYTHLTLPTKA